MNKQFIELSIKIKDEKNTLTVKESYYGDLVLSTESTFIKEKVIEALETFGYDPNLESPSIKIKATMTWQP